jgi:hypothetical protein
LALKSPVYVQFAASKKSALRKNLTKYAFYAAF